MSGALEHCTLFFVPLLDGHEPGNIPLTEEQALDAVRAIGFKPERWDTVMVKKTVDMPIWHFTDQMAVHAQASSVTRLCWSITLRREADETTPFCTEIWIMVDYYKGEILSGDTTGRF